MPIGLILFFLAASAWALVIGAFLLVTPVLEQRIADSAVMTGAAIMYAVAR